VRALLDAARAGDQEAFGDLVTLHHRAVFRTALAALGAREDAEDATQETFVMAWQKLAGFRGQATFRTWLLTIVWRKALDRRRARRLWWTRTQTGSQTAIPGDALEHVASESADPEHAAIARDLSQRVHEEVMRLSPKLRDALLLAASGEHAYDEIAAILDAPLGTVKWRVAEARRILGLKLDASGVRPR
jgi:RNA polymerase sigma-70 factor (ECF subfamily)